MPSPARLLRATAAENGASSKIPERGRKEGDPGRFADLPQRERVGNLKVLREPEDVEIPNRIAKDLRQGELPKKP